MPAEPPNDETEIRSEEGWSDHNHFAVGVCRTALRRYPMLGTAIDGFLAAAYAEINVAQAMIDAATIAKDLAAVLEGITATANSGNNTQQGTHTLIDR